MQISAGKGKSHGSIQISTACAEMTEVLSEINNPAVNGSMAPGSLFSVSSSLQSYHRGRFVLKL